MLTTTLIAGTRAELSRHLARRLRFAARRAVRHVRFACRRIADAHRQRHEIEMLLRADDRMLADIGLTRAEVHFVFGGGGKAGTWNAARDCDEALAAGKSDTEALPQVQSPALAPVSPRHTVTHENFR